jgi:uncharacterized protein with von Willebrand factor type A (vWA) domain
MILTTLYPNFKETNEPNSDFVFVLDCSGSMSGSRIKKAIECLNLFLRSLPLNCYFNIICFGSRFKSFFNETVEYNDQNLGIALNKLESTSANMGGTEILKPLLSIYHQKSIPNRVTQIFILSDGEVSNTNDVLSSVSVHKNSHRIFSIGVGSGADAGLINGFS